MTATMSGVFCDWCGRRIPCAFVLNDICAYCRSQGVGAA